MITVFGVRQVLDLATVFAARSGGALTSLIFIPIYSRMLSADEFGLASLALTIQASVAIADLGFGLLTSREVARSAAGARRERHTALRLVLACERILGGLYGLAGVLLLVATLLAILFGHRETAAVTLLGTLFVAFTLLLVLQQIQNGVLVALQSYWMASSSQIVGVLGRAFATVAGFELIGASIETFIAIQVAALLLHYAWTRWLALSAFQQSVRMQIRKCDYRTAFAASLPFLALSFTGVLATQLDKPMLAALRGGDVLAQYFLAYTYAQALISLLAAPVAQYFQPKVVAAFRAQEKGDLDVEAQNITSRMSVALVLFVMCPATIMALKANLLISLWLHGLETSKDVAHLARILLVGAVIYVFAFLPYALLTAANQIGFMARLSWALCAVVVPALALAAWAEGSVAVAGVVVVHQIVITFGFWYRALSISASAKMARAGLVAGCNTIALLIPWYAFTVLFLNNMSIMSNYMIAVTIFILALFYFLVALFSIYRFSFSRS